ncbi:MAG: hypothetical protein AAB428_01685 [Patescibacteria group bacterium]
MINLNLENNIVASRFAPKDMAYSATRDAYNISAKVRRGGDF